MLEILKAGSISKLWKSNFLNARNDYFKKLKKDEESEKKIQPNLTKFTLPEKLV